MTSKQEEINETVHLFLRNAYKTGRDGRGLKEDEMVKGFLGALSLHDVVVKVKRELPKSGDFHWYDDWGGECGRSGFELALKEMAGYEAVENLIKEVK